MYLKVKLVKVKCTTGTVHTATAHAHTVTQQNGKSMAKHGRSRRRPCDNNTRPRSVRMSHFQHDQGGQRKLIIVPGEVDGKYTVMNRNYFNLHYRHSTGWTSPEPYIRLWTSRVTLYANGRHPHQMGAKGRTVSVLTYSAVYR